MADDDLVSWILVSFGMEIIDDIEQPPFVMTQVLAKCLSQDSTVSGR